MINQTIICPVCNDLTCANSEEIDRFDRQKGHFFKINESDIYLLLLKGELIFSYMIVPNFAQWDNGKQIPNIQMEILVDKTFKELWRETFYWEEWLQLNPLHQKDYYQIYNYGKKIFDRQVKLRIFS